MHRRSQVAQAGAALDFAINLEFALLFAITVGAVVGLRLLTMIFAPLMAVLVGIFISLIILARYFLDTNINWCIFDFVGSVGALFGGIAFNPGMFHGVMSIAKAVGTELQCNW